MALFYRILLCYCIFEVEFDLYSRDNVAGGYWSQDMQKTAESGRE